VQGLTEGTNVGEEASVAEHAMVSGRWPASQVVQLALGLGAVGHACGGWIAGQRRGLV
jgi:hypothetical protein